MAFHFPLRTPNVPGAAPAALGETAAAPWWLVLMRGLLGVAFGLLALFLPGPTLASLILLFSIYLLFDGVAAIMSAVRAVRNHAAWGWFFLEGVVDLAASAIAFFWPAVTIIAFVWISAAWALVSGALMIAAAVRWRQGRGRWWLAVAGLISVVWAVLLFIAPNAGALAMTLWLGVYALAFGVSLLLMAVRLRAARFSV